MGQHLYHCGPTGAGASTSLPGLGVRLLSGAVSGQVLREAQLSGLGGKGTGAQILPMERLAGIEARTK